MGAAVGRGSVSLRRSFHTQNVAFESGRALEDCPRILVVLHGPQAGRGRGRQGRQGGREAATRQLACGEAWAGLPGGRVCCTACTACRKRRNRAHGSHATACRARAVLPPKPTIRVVHCSGWKNALSAIFAHLGAPHTHTLTLTLTHTRALTHTTHCDNVESSYGRWSEENAAPCALRFEMNLPPLHHAHVLAGNVRRPAVRGRRQRPQALRVILGSCVPGARLPHAADSRTKSNCLRKWQQRQHQRQHQHQRRTSAAASTMAGC